jgi:hypothetical protein
MVLNKSDNRKLNRVLVWAKKQDDPGINELIELVNLLHHKALHYKVRSEKLESFFKNSRK